MADESLVNEVFRSFTDVNLCLFMYEPQKFPHTVIPLNNT